MGTAWGLVVLGAVLVFIASRPVQRARQNATETRAKEPKVARQPQKSAPVPAPAPEPKPALVAPAPRAEDSLTPQWLDSLIGSDASSTPAEDPLDDAEGIASVLRLWLAEDTK
jgi:hypothetical protein